MNNMLQAGATGTSGPADGRGLTGGGVAEQRVRPPLTGDFLALGRPPPGEGGTGARRCCDQTNSKKRQQRVPAGTDGQEEASQGLTNNDEERT